MRLVYEGRVAVVCSDEIIKEVTAVFLELAGACDGRLHGPLRAVARLLLRAIHCSPPNDVAAIRVCRDPDDDKFVACAIAGSADFILTRNSADFEGVEKAVRELYGLDIRVRSPFQFYVELRTDSSSTAFRMR